MNDRTYRDRHKPFVSLIHRLSPGQALGNWTICGKKAGRQMRLTFDRPQDPAPTCKKCAQG